MKPLAEINLEAIRLLYRELGVVNAVRLKYIFVTTLNLSLMGAWDVLT